MGAVKNEVGQNKRRVLVLYSRSLLAQAVARLLERGQGLEVMGLDLDQPRVADQAQAYHPEWVLVDSAELPQGWSLLAFELWRQNPRVKIGYLDMGHSWVEVVSGRQVAVNSCRDLVRALEGT